MPTTAPPAPPHEDARRGALGTAVASRPARARDEQYCLSTAEGFRRWYAATFERAVAILVARTGDREQAQDCVQQAYLRAWERRHDVARHGRPDAWINLTAARLAISGWRRAGVRRRDPDRALTPPVVAAAPTEDRVALAGALRQLPEQQRRAVVLFYLADVGVDDIAARLDVPSGTVKSWLHRARSALADLLDPDPAGT